MIYFCRKCNLYYNYKILKDIKINTKLCLMCLLETMQKIYCDVDLCLDIDTADSHREPLICDYGFFDAIYYV